VTRDSEAVAPDERTILAMPEPVLLGFHPCRDLEHGFFRQFAWRCANFEGRSRPDTLPTHHP
jgi:hypothetical protein